MAVSTTTSYHHAWPYILEQGNEKSCIYIGDKENEYREVLEPVFDTVSTYKKYDNINSGVETQDLLILDNPPTINKDIINHAIRYLSPGGYLALRVGGTNRLRPLSRSFGLHQGDNGTPLRDVFQSLRGIHQNLIARYAVVSSYQRETSFIVDLDSKSAIRWLLNLGDEPGANRLIDYTTRIGEYMHQVGLFKYFLPSFVFVYGSNTSVQPRFNVQKSTVNRSTLLNYESGSIETIRKIPTAVNREFVEREIEVMQEIRSSLDYELKRTIPETEWVQMNGRDIVNERPVSGYTISNHYNREPAAFSKAIEIPFTWLVEVFREQAAYRRSVTNKDYIELMTFEGGQHTVVSDLLEPIEYPVSPCHGDFFGPNILTDGSKVTGVIDWEWGSVEGSPIVDALFCLFQLADTLFDNFSKGILKMFINETKHSAIVWDALHNFCQAVDCQLRDLVYLLPYPYLRRARIQKQRYGHYEQDWIQKADHAVRMARMMLKYDSSYNIL